MDKKVLVIGAGVAGPILALQLKKKQIAKLDTAYQKEQYGIETIQIKRANLNKHVRLAAKAAGIKIWYDKKIVRYNETN